MRIKRMHDVFGVLMAMGTLAALAVDEGDAERAAMLLGATEANWHQYGACRARRRRPGAVREGVQKVLGESAAHLRRGRADDPRRGDQVRGEQRAAAADRAARPPLAPGVPRRPGPVR